MLNRVFNLTFSCPILNFCEASEKKPQWCDKRDENLCMFRLNKLEVHSKKYLIKNINYNKQI